MSLQMKDIHNAVWYTVNEFKCTTASVMSLYGSDWQVRPENPQSLKISCFPQMLLTYDSCWASSNQSWRKESSRFAPDRANKGFQAAGIQLKPREGRESHLEGQHSQKNSSIQSSPWNDHFVNEDSVRALGACECSLTTDACLHASPTNPLQTNHYFQGRSPDRMTGSHDTHSSTIHLPNMTDQKSCRRAAAATSEADL